ncbi:MAG: hypothetical protein HY986_26410 [Candidatus Melainabacteria bacterium]|nr:hypothetical protein [Candidatus Melainabacteria bacterium]
MSTSPIHLNVDEDSFTRQFTLRCEVESLISFVESIYKPVYLDAPIFRAARRARERFETLSFGAGAEDLLLEIQQELLPLVQSFVSRLQRQQASENERERTIDFLPQFNEDGYLPVGIYTLAWRRLDECYSFTERRRRQLQGLLAALHIFKRHSLSKVYIGGSFVTGKRRPTDIDLVCTGKEASLIDVSVLASSGNELSSSPRSIYGIDVTFGDKTRAFSKLQYCSVFSAELTGLLELPGGPLPKKRLVGIVELDLEQSFPDPIDFIPGYMWQV